MDWAAARPAPGEDPGAWRRRFGTAFAAAWATGRPVGTEACLELVPELTSSDEAAGGYVALRDPIATERREYDRFGESAAALKARLLTAVPNDFVFPPAADPIPPGRPASREVRPARPARLRRVR